jgi:hypothetical protein
VIGTYGAPAPRLSLDFLAADGSTVSAYGTLAAGAREGSLSIPLAHVRGAPESRSFCLHIGPQPGRYVFGGWGVAVGPTAAQVDGSATGGAMSVIYYRAGRESWWSLLGAVDQRFAWGKSAPLGRVTLPLCALLLLGVWVATLRLLLRESEPAR